MRFSWKLVAVGTAAVFALVACGGGDETSSPTSPAIQDDSSSDDPGNADGGDTAASAAGGLPSGAGEGFPIAIPEGWVIDIHGSAGLTISGSVQLAYPLDEYDAVVAFYDEWTAQQADEYTRSETGTSVLFLVNTPTRTINISNDYEEQGTRYTLVQAIAAES